MKKLMTFITLSAAAVSIYAQANEQPHQAHMNMPMSTDSAMQQELMQGMNQMHQDMNGSYAISRSRCRFCSRYVATPYWRSKNG